MAFHYYELKVGYVCGGQYAMNVFMYRIADPTEPNDWRLAKQLLEATAAGGAASWLRKLQNLMSQDSFISSLRARRVAPTQGNTASQVFEVDDLVGQIADDMHTGQIAAGFIWVSESGDTQVGRNFIPGVAEESLDSGRWSAAYAALALAFRVKHIPGHSVAGGIFEPVIYDRVAKTGLLIDDGYLSPLVATVRQRETPV